MSENATFRIHLWTLYSNKLPKANPINYSRYVLRCICSNNILKNHLCLSTNLARHQNFSLLLCGIWVLPQVLYGGFCENLQNKCTEQTSGWVLLDIKLLTNCIKLKKFRPSVSAFLIFQSVSFSVLLKAGGVCLHMRQNK